MTKKILRDYCGNVCPTKYPLEVLESAAGFYVGQLDEDGFPYSRISPVYYRTEEAARKALPLYQPKGVAESQQ